MAKKSKKKGQEPEIKEKEEIITGAVIKDDFCNYTLDKKTGKGAGNHAIKGIGIVDPDMKIAFARLNAHLAALDDAFKESGVEDDIDSLHQHELTNKYTATGFSMKGTPEDRQVILMGTKFSETASGYLDIKITKQNLDRGAYKWYNELRDAIEKAMQEVELYHGGKYTLPEKEQEVDPNQMSIVDVDFEEGKVD